ncbi:hypothetical protein GGD66_007893 [Bradyrhizobium sp. CIR48]|nr:hypothetical protein [Bradyrhizobium sp. CIR18]MBB4429291.1 hypothetical protein [Bradyrhizobium sp. CIR48]
MYSSMMRRASFKRDGWATFPSVCLSGSVMNPME